MRHRLLFTRILPLFAALAAGCATHAPNPSFNITNDDARAAIREMTHDAKPLPRPLVILGGLDDPGFATMILGDDFRDLSGGDPRVIGVSFFFCGTFDHCRKRVIEAVDKAFPSDDPVWTTEVDVIAVSMGGLVARYAAAAPPHQRENEASANAASQPTTDRSPSRRLRIARLFTISSPHRGASLASLPTFNQLQIDMRPGSKFLHQLNEADGFGAEASDGAVCSQHANYELIPYTRLDDVVVGERNAAPPGWTPWWVPGELFQDSHLFAMADPRIVADIARRLWNETPLTTSPPTPLPAS